MKSLMSLALIFLMTEATSARPNSSSNKKNPAAQRAQLGTSFKFDGTALRGKYQTSLGTAATVENDKLLDDLLKGRTQFADRQKQEAERN